MYRPKHLPATQRRGVILLVVITLLTLFAVVGLTFVLYAEGEANASRFYREAQDQSGFAGEPIDYVMSYALGEMIYDVSDNAPDVYSAIRGHSLARGIFGWNDGAPGGNTTPFNGTGALHTNNTDNDGKGNLLRPCMNPFNQDDFLLRNYTCFTADGFVRDPERLYPNYFANPPQYWRTSLSGQRGAYTGGANVPYTYADLNNMALAAVKADGTVLAPSFHRSAYSWPLDMNPLTNPQYWKWIQDYDPAGPPTATQPWLKYQVLRPRPADHLGFPPPADPGGDVKNLVGAPGGNDSIWIDLGYPVKTLPDGRKYKPLFAFLVRDLDALINLNVHGNILGLTAPGVYTSLSNQGWTKTEVNVGKVLNVPPPPGGPNEWPNLFRGNGIVNGRYGQDQLPGYYNAGPPVTATNAAPFSPQPHVYAQADYDGTNGANAATQAPLLPGAGAYQSYASYPQFPGGSVAWQNGFSGSAELQNNPSVFNYFNPASNGGGDSLFRVNELKKLLCTDATGRLDTSDSVLAALCPQNFLPPAYGGAPGSDRRRRLVTPLSMDVDRAGVSPMIWDPTDGGAMNPSKRFVLTAPPPPALAITPSGGPIPFPALNQRNSNTPPTYPLFSPPNSEFTTAEWRALSSQLARVNLNRTLTSYPLPTAGAIDLTNANNVTQYQQAVADRQQFAQDLFTCLRTVVGAQDPTTTFTTYGGATSPEFNGLRWLAQLAVNIVDYIDSDNYITPFNWFTEPVAPNTKHWVYGTELPGLVLNEFYIEMTDDTASVVGGKATNYNLNIWLELYNSRLRDLIIGGVQSDPDNGDTRLKVGTNGIYQVQITKPNTLIRAVDNTDGHADNPAQIYSTEGQGPLNWGANPNVTVTAQSPTPLYGQQGGQLGGGEQGFYLIGPTNPMGATVPFPGSGTTAQGYVPTTNLDLSTQSMYVKVPVTDLGDPTVATNLGPAILLRRLACPHLPFDNNQTTAMGTPNPFYNPYITVDYVQTRHSTAAGAFDELNDATTVLPGGGTHTPNPPQNRFAWGRNQPYAADVSLRQKQAPAPAYTTCPQNTFGRQNGQEATPPNAPDNPTPVPANTTPTQTLQLPFDWLVHLDRQLISPTELMHVSAFKPHELTQQFMKSLNNNFRAYKVSTEKFQHRAPWLNADTRIFRALEFLSTGDRCAGVGTGGRIPGKININGIWDYETFLALCDPQTSNSFTPAAPQPPDANVQIAFNQMMGIRSPGGAPGTTDRPFRGIATPYANAADPQYPSGIGLTDTVLNPNALLLPDATDSTHPYQRFELLTKIFNNLTTRSNTFAIWCTVGYFQVMDDTTRPVKLGQELGLAQGQNIRQRFFAVVDRTNLTIGYGQTATVPSGDPRSNITPSPNPQTVPVLSVSGNFGNATVGSTVPWSMPVPPFGPTSFSVIIDFGEPNQETVTVTNVTPLISGPPIQAPTITAIFSQQHSPGATITVAGPQSGPPVIFTNSTSAVTSPGPGTWMDVSSLSGTYDGTSWSIQQPTVPPASFPSLGSILVVDVGANQEIVEVLSTGTDPTTKQTGFTANFQKTHPNGCVISNTPIGNPGPQPNFNYKDPRYAPVVRYFAILDSTP
jgi:hypothetical protein